jgi:hypothetical protein
VQLVAERAQMTALLSGEHGQVVSHARSVRDGSMACWQELPSSNSCRCRRDASVRSREGTRLVTASAMRFIAIALVCGACSTSTSFTATNPSPRQLSPRAADSVELYTTTLPTREYVEVGIVGATPNVAMDDASVLVALRAKAAAHGCDAVIVNGSNKIASLDGNAVTERTRFRGACIVYR